MNRVCDLFGVTYPIVQGGMVWASGWRLASAVSNAGGLGIIGAGSMYPDILREHIRKCKKATNKSFGVNIPLLYPDLEEIVAIVLEEKVPIISTSAGNPKIWTQTFKSEGRKVFHVVSSAKFARKAQDAGVDAVVAEGFEAGGHNGREETTTMVLVPLVCEAVTIPVLAAGGIASGHSMAAAMALGAEGVQVGSRFVASREASSHINFKQKVIEAQEGDTQLTLKELTPVRLLKNPFYTHIQELYARHASPEELAQALGRGRAKRGMYEGDWNEGELEIGQASAYINSISSAKEIIDSFIREYEHTRTSLHQFT